jgi:hypothetical protein
MTTLGALPALKKGLNGLRIEVEIQSPDSESAMTRRTDASDEHHAGIDLCRRVLVHAETTRLRLLGV